ncbi:hypothetical protein BDW22DRAFT_1424353 [Trametopsis cervina]|nr:hypothetical protein BDW22DRAFT_1424353 [Trametopsis cervina]
MAESSHWRMQLNNLLQRSYGTRVLTWQTEQIGPQHVAPWVATALVNGVNYGSGQAHTQGEAKEQAARVAYYGLMDELSRRR